MPDVMDEVDFLPVRKTAFLEKPMRNCLLISRSLRPALAVVLATSFVTAQAEYRITALRPLDTLASAASPAVPTADRTAAGVLATDVQQWTQSGSGTNVASATISALSGPRGAINVSAGLLADTFPAFASAGPVDVVMEVLLTPPTYATLIIRLDGFSDPDTSLSTDVDIMNDGSFEMAFQGVGGTNTLEIEVPVNATSVPIRFRAYCTASAITAAAGASVARTASASFSAGLRPRSLCTVTELSSSSCGDYTPSVLATSADFDGNLNFRVVNSAQRPFFLVIGLQQTPMTLPLPLLSGTCDLVPSPDLVVPFATTGTSLASIAVRVSSLPSSPFTFYAQTLGLDLQANVALLGVPRQITCP